MAVVNQRFSTRALVWQLRSRRLTFDRRSLLMGIVNVTPDSFSDGGRFLEPATAVDHALQLEADGADILDVGGESARPYSEPVDADEELRRVMPVLEKLCGRTKLPVSIDTTKTAVARRAIEAGVEIVNDLTGLEGDAGMVPLVAESRVGVCAMHMQGTPQTMQDSPTYDDVVADVYRYLQQRRDALVAAGVDRERICLDPGIGFGKTHEHNLELLSSVDRFHALGCPLLVGHSRKGFIGKVLGDKEADATAGTIGVAVALATRGVQVLRVHDVRPVREALALFDAAGGMTE